MKTKLQNVINARKIAGAFSMVALAAAGLSTPYARADILPAIAGHAWIAGDQTCFNSSWAQVQNSCNSARKYLIAVPIRATGNSPVHVRAYAAAPSGYVRCRAVVNNGSNGLVGQSSFVSTNVFGWQTINLGVLNVPHGATLHFDCDVSGNNSAAIANVNWIQ